MQLAEAIPMYLATGLLLFCGPVLSAQACPHTNVYEAAPIDEVLRASIPDVIFRYSAIAGDTIAPALQRLSKPDNAVGSIPGTAQVSLARLGDKTAIKELEEELNHPNSSSKAIPKLVRVGTDSALSILMGYLSAHASDNSLYHNFGDHSSDVRRRLVEGLSQQLQIGPILPSGFFSASFQDWVKWWDQNKGKPIVLSISGDFRDPYLQCLARKVEWGFPDAIFDMVRTRDPQVLPVLGLLAKFGNPKRRPFNLATPQGRAQLGLAQLGDREELQTVEKELDLPGFGSAIEELRQLGGPVAVSALINDLDSPNYLPEYKAAQGYERLANEHNQAIEDALATMVVSPPETQVTPKRAKQWQAWWAKNRDSAQFVKPPVTNHE